MDLAECTKRSLEEFISRLVSDVEIEEQVQVEHKEKNDGKEDTPIQKLKRKKGLDRSENFTEMEVSAVEKELAIYHKMKEPDATISILQFWKRNREVLPLLSKAAQAILAVLCASSSVERVFSIAGLTVGVRRRSLVPKSVETIVIMRSNKGRVNFSEFREEDNSSSDEEDAESDDGEPVTETVEEEEIEENSDEESEPEEEIRLKKNNPTKAGPVLITKFFLQLWYRDRLRERDRLFLLLS